MATKTKTLPSVRPGEILAEHFIAGYDKPTAYRVAIGMGLRLPVVYEIISGKRSIATPDSSESVNKKLVGCEKRSKYTLRPVAARQCGR